MSRAGTEIFGSQGKVPNWGSIYSKQSAIYNMHFRFSYKKIVESNNNSHALQVNVWRHPVSLTLEPDFVLNNFLCILFDIIDMIVFIISV